MPIRFSTYNPYESRFPGLRVVSRETLHLIKYLRSEGHEVIVEPNDGTKLNYLAQKGLQEVLSDPINLFVIGIPLSIILNLIANWLYDRFTTPVPEENKPLIEFDEQGRKLYYNTDGQLISERRFTALLNSLDERARDYARSQILSPPDISRPIPINLEHTGEVVGWAKEPVIDDIGLRFDDIVIVDDEAWKRIGSGELKGLSIGGIIHSSTCSICDGEYTDCNHIAGNHYYGSECGVRIDGIYVAECSIVKEPIQPLAKLNIHFLR